MAALVLAAAISSALQDTFAAGRIHLFSWEFQADLPARFAGASASFCSRPWLSSGASGGGLADARAGRPPYVMGLLIDPLHRKEYIRTNLATIRNLVVIGIILDVVAQFLIFQQVHPGAALLIGPVLITAPYAIARGLTNRVRRMVK